MKSVCTHLAAGSVRLDGPAGKMLKLSIANRLKKVNYTHLVDPFRFRNEGDNAWRCEFWGKIVRSLILSWRDTQDEELLAIIRATVKDILSTQTPDGCISSYPAEKQTDGWDIWGRKYVLWGLARYYFFVEKDPAVAAAAGRIVDHLMTQVGPGAGDILACGRHGGLAASSILDAIVDTYRMTGEQRHLKYAEWIAARGCSEKHNVFEAVLDGVKPADLGNGKAYEMMSCFQGLAELYAETGKPEYLEPVLAFYRAVRDREIIITGVGGSKDQWGEYWNDTAFLQLETDLEKIGYFGETCVNTTWIHYCEVILRLTEEPGVADQLEKSYCNAILGGVSPEGDRWVHRNPSPLAGASCKLAADDQILRGFKTPFDGNDCCLAQGPEALAMIPYTSLMKKGDTLLLNYYEAMSADFATPSGKKASLAVTGAYPAPGKVTVKFSLGAAEKFPVSFRIPEWSRNCCTLTLNGEKQDVSGMEYCTLDREWKEGDTVTFDFDFSVRILRNGAYAAVLCGPLVMVKDSRFGDVTTPLKDLDFAPAPSAPDFLYRLKNRSSEILCDYASAGKPFDEKNQLCIWMKVQE